EKPWIHLRFVGRKRINESHSRHRTGRARISRTDFRATGVGLATGGPGSTEVLERIQAERGLPARSALRHGRSGCGVGGTILQTHGLSGRGGCCREAKAHEIE